MFSQVPQKCGSNTNIGGTITTLAALEILSGLRGVSVMKVQTSLRT